MRLVGFCLICLIVQVDLRRQSDNPDDDDNGSYYEQADPKKLNLNDENDIPSVSENKKYSSRKKVLEQYENNDDDQEKLNPNRWSKTRNQSSSATTPANFADEASLCINEFDIKTEQLIKVKEMQNGAHMIRIVHVEEPSSTHGLTVRDICMLNCCVEKDCDLAMLSEQRTAVKTFRRSID